MVSRGRPVRMVFSAEIQARLPQVGSFGVDEATESKRQACERTRHGWLENSLASDSARMRTAVCIAMHAQIFFQLHAVCARKHITLFPHHQRIWWKIVFGGE
jgi:hypothetical protein